MYLIKDKVNLNSTVTMMEIEAKEIAQNALPGQFVILKSGILGERVPLTIFDNDNDSIKVIFQIVGSSTMKLNSLNKGDYIDSVVGPLGEATDLTNLTKAIVVGGGVGCAIAFPIVKALHKQGVHTTSIVGFRSKDLVILEDEFSNNSDEFILLTDDGSYGRKGLVTTALKELLEKGTYDKVIAIGPLPMMKYVCLTTKEFNTKTIVSMNSIMVDGTGMCGGCRVIVDGKQKFACVDGPDFDGHLVDFDIAMKRNGIYKSIEHHKYEQTCNLFKGDNNE